MSIAYAPALDSRPLLALLEGRFAAGSCDGDGDGLHGLPPALWERALLGPLRDFLARPGKELRARVVELGFTLGGGAAHALPPELPLLVEILHAGSLIIDDIEDGSPERRGRPALHRLHGVPLALNAGNWLYFWPQALLAGLALTPPARLRAHELIAACLLGCHEGQALDLALRASELARAELPRVARTLSALKTGELIALAAALGAIAAGAQEPRVALLARFGRELGVGLQMLDDLSGVLNPARRDKGLEDLQLGRVTWVWAWFAEQQGDTDYQALLAAARVAMQRDPHATEALLAQARFQLGMTGVRRVRRHLDGALAELQGAIGDGAWSAGVRAELDGLQRRFLEAP
jgi:geranylgeranyl pyrophosphate synthase